MGRAANLLRRFGRTEFMRKLGPKIMNPVDKVLHKLTGGRFHLTDAFMPVLKLHHTGRKSGLPRETMLSYVAVDGGWSVVGTNFGQDHHPAWALNLTDQPDARIDIRGEVFDVRARLVTERDEWDRIFPKFVEMFPGYGDYIERAGDRDIRLFVLEPRA